MLGATRNPNVTYVDEVIREVADGHRARRTTFTRPTSPSTSASPGRPCPIPTSAAKGPERTGCIALRRVHDGVPLRREEHARQELPLPRREARPRVRHRDARSRRCARIDGGYRVEAKHRRSARSASSTPTARDLRRRRARDARPAAPHEGETRQGLPRLSDRLGDFVRTNSEALIEVVSERRDHDFSKGVAIGSILDTDEHSHLEPVRYGAGSGFFRLLAAPHVAGATSATRMANLAGTVAASPGEAPARRRCVPDFARYSVILLYMRTLEGSLRMKLGRGLTTGFATGLTTELGDGPAPTASIPEATELARPRRREDRRLSGEPRDGDGCSACRRRRTSSAAAAWARAPRRASSTSDHRVFGYDGPLRHRWERRLGEPRGEPVADDHGDGRAGDEPDPREVSGIAPRRQWVGRRPR